MDAKTLCSSILAFSAKFHNELSKDKSAVSSPLSAELVLALLTLSTTGAAHDELLAALGLPDDDALRTSFSSLTARLRSLDGVTLSVANKIFVREGPYELEPDLESDAEAVFDAGIQKLDFSDGAAAAHHINSWVESKTCDRIKDLVTADSFGDDAVIIINAIYFKGPWMHRFLERNTFDHEFHVDTSTTMNVPMMKTFSRFNYGSSGDLQAELLDLAYISDNERMLIVLPNEVDGLQKVLQMLADGYDLLADVASMAVRQIEIRIPKFKIECTINLQKILTKLGINEIFGKGGVDKILLNQSEPMKVSKALQKTFIDVNEEGTEAAAATKMSITPKCIKHTFIADRPFLFLLTSGNGADRTVLFIGTYRGERYGESK